MKGKFITNFTQGIKNRYIISSFLHTPTQSMIEETSV